MFNTYIGIRLQQQHFKPSGLQNVDKYQRCTSRPSQIHMIRWTIEATCFLSTSENQRKTLFLSRSYLPCTFFLGGGGKDFNFCPSPSLSFIYSSACTCSSSDHSDTDEQLFTQTAVTGNWIIQMESKQLITR